MRKIYFILIIVQTVSFSQSFQWVDFPSITFSGNSRLIGYPITTDIDGNVFLTGYKNNQLNYGEIYGTLHFRKYNSQGQLVFNKEFLGTSNAHNIISDSNGNILIALHFKNSITIDNLTITAQSQGIQPLLLKFDNLGNLVWFKEIKDLNADADFFKAVSVDSSDNVYVGYDNFINSYITKLSPTGALLFTINQFNVNLITSLSVDSLGNIYAAGSCAQVNATYNGIAAPTNFEYNTYVVKYSNTGVFQWTKYVQDITCAEPILAISSPNEIYISSRLYASFPFDTITIEGLNSSEEFFVAKLDASGNYLWVKKVPNISSGTATIGNRNFLTSDTFGNVYFGGRTSGNVDWSSAISTNILPPDNYDLLILKYNSQGEVIMAKTAGGATLDRIDGFSVSPDGSIYTSGMVNGNSYFDTITHQVSSTGAYPFIGKISQTLSNNTNSQAIVKLFPNPATDRIYLSNLVENTSGNIYNVLGQQLLHFEIFDNTPILIQNLSTGVYYLTIDNGETFKFIKK